MAANANVGGQVTANGRSDTAFYVVFAVVFSITIASLGLGLLRSSQRTIYVNQEVTRIESQVPKGDVKNTPAPEELERQKAMVDRETNDQENAITILFGVFQAGTGAILGLLTGKATSK